MSRRALLGGSVVLALCCAAPHGIEPPRIHYGQDVCASCNMIISEERFASAMVLREEDGTIRTRLFDDIGCMMDARAREAPARVVALYVHDLDSGQWIPAGSAFYVRGRELRSPMLSGLAAWADRERARRGAERFEGQTLGFAQLSADPAPLTGRIPPG